MGIATEYLIPFKNLENGIHNHSFQVSTEFFNNFENSRIQKGKYEVNLILDKRDSMMILDFSFEGQFEASCDRCMAMIDIPSLGEDQIIVKIKEVDEVEEKDNVVILDPDSYTLDISAFIIDMLILNLPLINERDCEAEDYKYCNHDILDKIEYDSIKEDKEEKSGDVWDSLKDLNID